MTNELIFLALTIIDLVAVLVAAGLGLPYLYVTIATNLILVSTFGGKLISIFGFTTNAGNAFYACVFLATHIITEHFGKKEGLKTIPIGLMSIILFIIMSQLTIRLVGLPDSTVINGAMSLLFDNAPRIAIASMVAYISTQSLNIWIYNLLHEKSGRSYLWLRDNFSNLSGQFVDSILFFSIAFLGILPGAILIQSIFTGFLVKVVVGMLGTPFLYLSYLFIKTGIATKDANKI